jgi:toxin YhaV
MVSKKIYLLFLMNIFLNGTIEPFLKMHKLFIFHSLAAIAKLAFDVIPQDPTRSEYRQGATLGSEYKHWFRAKFFQQYRLFFRYHLDSKIIIFAWVNDEGSKRAYESNTDAYRVFKKMLESGHPPDDWNDLLKEAKGETKRLVNAVNRQEMKAF